MSIFFFLQVLVHYTRRKQSSRIVGNECEETRRRFLLNYFDSLCTF